jgi:DNA-binding LacI/PurR family transcriptional regulator
MDGTKPQLKHRLVYQQLLQAIKSGEYPPDHKLPSDQELSQKFQISRMTIIRALNDLQSVGLVRRRAGSGTYVCAPQQPERHTFGLLIPELGATEIFEPICRGMAQAGELAAQALLWGNATPGVSDEQIGLDLCKFYISQRVAGVFFAPLEFTPSMDRVNLEIVSNLDRAGIPVILLDRCVLPYPHRSRYDLVGIDNRRAGFRMTDHLFALGCRRIAFVANPWSAPTVEARIAGYRDAHYSRRIPYEEAMAVRCGLQDLDKVRNFLQTHRPDGIVCANDRTAGRLMHSLSELGVRIPSDLRIVGIDDVKYAHLLSVPLTTLRQPCAEIGAAAIAAMIERIAKPDMTARDILLDCELVIRKSCGASAE